MNEAGTAPDHDELIRLVHEVVESLDGDITRGDLRLFAEMEAIRETIRQVRRELADMGTSGQPHSDLALVTDQLDAVVAATAEAADRILDAAETVEKLAGAVEDADVRDTLERTATGIYEACNFQDITGQRIGKVVQTMKSIEEKVDGMARALGVETQVPRETGPSSVVTTDGETDLLAGPSLNGAGNSQDDIDALLASLD